MKNVKIAYFTFAKNGATIQITKEVRAGFPKVLQVDRAGNKEAFVMLKIFEKIEEFMEECYESFGKEVQ